MHACMHACMHGCLSVCLSVCLYVLLTSIHPSIHSSIHTYIHVHIYTYICYVDKYTLCRYIYIYIQCLNNASHVSNQALPTLLRSKCVILHNCPSESHGFCHHSAISTKVMTLTAMTTHLTLMEAIVSHLLMRWKMSYRSLKTRISPAEVRLGNRSCISGQTGSGGQCCSS